MAERPGKCSSLLGPRSTGTCVVQGSEGPAPTLKDENTQLFHVRAAVLPRSRVARAQASAVAGSLQRVLSISRDAG